MLFPNRAPAPQMRPAMGYSSGANRFGYVAHMGYSSGANRLGDISGDMQLAAFSNGISQSDINLLNSLGATDNDIADLLNGTITLPALYAQYGATMPASTSVVQTGSSPSASPTLWSPAGSTLLFTCNWTAGVGNLSVSPNAAISALTSQLTQHGMSVISSQVTSSGPVNYGIQVTILDNASHDTQYNALSVPLGIMQGIVGNNFSSAPTLTMVAPGGTSSAAASAAASSALASLASNPLAWLENNFLYIGLGIGALILINNFTGKRR